MTDTRIEELYINVIRTDQMQIREKVDPDVVGEYAELYESGSKFPPLVVFHDADEDNYWLADGHHRLDAARIVDQMELPCEIHVGGKREALLYAVGANASHGLRRTNEDKRNAVTKMLQDPVVSTHENGVPWNNSEIARWCNVDEKTVRNIKKKLGLSSDYPRIDGDSDPESRKVKVRRGDSEYEMTLPPQDDVDSSEPEVDKSDEPDPPKRRKLTDKIGNEIKTPEVAMAFDIIPQLKRLMDAIDDVRQTLKRMDGEPGITHIHMQHVESSLKNAKIAIKDGLPHCLCPPAVAEKNDKWGEIGFLTQRQYNLLPEEDKSYE